MYIYHCAFCGEEEPVLFLMGRHFKDKHPIIFKHSFERTSPTFSNGRQVFWTASGGVLFWSVPDAAESRELEAAVKKLKEWSVK